MQEGFKYDGEASCKLLGKFNVREKLSISGQKLQYFGHVYVFGHVKTMSQPYRSYRQGCSIVENDPRKFWEN